MASVNITHGGIELVVRGSNIGKRVKENILRRVFRISEIDNPERRGIAVYAAVYLSHVESGDIGIYIPTEDDDISVVNKFIDEFKELDAALLDAIDNGIEQTRVVTNSPDLLPPGELPDAKKKTQKSGKSE